MEASVAPLTPPPSRVIRQQVALLASPSAMVSLVVALVGVQALANSGLAGTPSRIQRLPVFDVFPFLILIGALWPAIVWHGEGPSDREYHWSLPVVRANHDMVRVIAGALWRTLGVLAVEVFQVGTSILGGYGTQMAQLSLGTWINYVTGPLTMYLLVSALAIATDHPLRWLIGGVFGIGSGVSACKSAVACDYSPLQPALQHSFGLSDVLAPYISPEVYQVNGVGPGAGGMVLIILGLAAGAVAVYGAARLRSR